MNANDKQILARSKLQDIVNQINSHFTLDPEVEDVRFLYNGLIIFVAFCI